MSFRIRGKLMHSKMIFFLFLGDMRDLRLSDYISFRLLIDLTEEFRQ